jgi:RNA polymerase sigma factor (sigma-70 family)
VTRQIDSRDLFGGGKHLAGPNIRVAGAEVDESVFLKQVQESEEQSTSLLVDQIREDAAAGGEVALGLVLLSRAFRSLVLAYLGHGVLKGQHELALEAWNDTLYRVYTRIGSYDSRRSSFRTWVVNQARYAALSLLRREARERAVPQHPLPEVAATEPDLPEPLTQREQQAFRRAWGRLTDTERKLLEWRFIHGLRHVEIARKQLSAGLPEEYVRIYVNRSARRLRDFFKEELRTRS